MVLLSVCVHGIVILLIAIKAGAVKQVEVRPAQTLSLFNLIEEEPSPPKLPPPPAAIPPPVQNAPAEALPEPAPEAAVEPGLTPEPAAEEPAAVPDSAAGGIVETADRNADTSVYVRKNYEYIQRRICGRLVYPARARRVGIEGTVETAFTIQADDSIGGVSIRKSCGSAVLDEAALEAVRRVAPFRPPPAPARMPLSVS